MKDIGMILIGAGLGIIVWMAFGPPSPELVKERKEVSAMQATVERLQATSDACEIHKITLADQDQKIEALTDAMDGLSSTSLDLSKATEGMIARQVRIVASKDQEIFILIDELESALLNKK